MIDPTDPPSPTRSEVVLSVVADVFGWLGIIALTASLVLIIESIRP